MKILKYKYIKIEQVVIEGTNFKIQTASYGSVPPNEIKKVIEGFKIALDTIDIIKNNFMEGE